jgi:hypothetical protein
VTSDRMLGEYVDRLYEPASAEVSSAGR